VKDEGGGDPSEVPCEIKPDPSVSVDAAAVLEIDSLVDEGQSSVIDWDRLRAAAEVTRDDRARMADFGSHTFLNIMEAQDHCRVTTIDEAQQIVIVLRRGHPVLLMVVVGISKEVHVLRLRPLEFDEGNLADAQGLTVTHGGREPPPIRMPKQAGVLEARDREGRRLQLQGVIIDRLDGENLEVGREVDQIVGGAEDPVRVEDGVAKLGGHAVVRGADDHT
jgi:hypothetical protein